MTNWETINKHRKSLGNYAGFRLHEWCKAAFVMGLVGMFYYTLFTGEQPPPKVYVNGFEIVKVGQHEYIITRGWTDVLTHFEDCPNLEHKKPTN